MKKQLLTVIAVLIGGFAFAQSNSSFETWTAGVPDNWIKVSGKVNEYTSKTVSTSSGNITINAQVGSKFAGVQSDTAGAPSGQFFRGILKSDQFAYSMRPNGAQARILYLTTSSSETFAIAFYLTKWNGTSRDTIMKKLSYLSTGGPILFSGGAWAILNMNFVASDYVMSGNPDSCQIMLLSNITTAATINAELLIDEIHFNSFGVGMPQLMPSDFESISNYPNPFNNTTVIKFQQLRENHVTIEVFDITGQKVATAVNEVFPEGKHLVSFDGSTLKPGIYFYTIESGDYTETRKMIISR
jgi:hypothetical protein